MKTVLLALALLLSGCTFRLLEDAMNKNQTLSQEQIDAYNKVGLDVYGCFQLGGPPPVGNTVWIVVPKTTKPTVNFGPGCVLMPAIR